MGHTKQYSGKFRAKMVQRLSGPTKDSASALSKKVGVPQSTLSRWLREAGRVPVMKKNRPEPPSRSGESKRPGDWTDEDRLKVVGEAVGFYQSSLLKVCKMCC